jgi:hypothetical protein
MHGPRTRTLAAILALALVPGLAGCPAAAVRPVVDRAASPEVRMIRYDGARLAFNNSYFLPKWSRDDGAYGLGQLDDVLNAYPESRDARSRVLRTGMLIGAIAGVGGALIGYPLGYNLSAPRSRQLSTGVQAAMYGTGAGLAALAIVLSATWGMSVQRDLAPAYNDALREDFDLAGPPAATPKPTDPAPPAGGAGVSMTFGF